MDDCIQPYVHVAFRLPSDLTKIQQIIPNTTISLGKFGSFPANQIIGRPFHLTFEILDRNAEREHAALRVVPPAELYEEIREDDDIIGNQTPRVEGEENGEEYEVVNDEGSVVMRTNRNIMDDGAAQKLTSEDIEALKKAETASGKNIIAKILESHSALDKKTAFSLAKYTLRKHKKYMKRFTALPLDVAQLTNYMLFEKDSRVTMEIREEMLAQTMSWANAHCGGQPALGQVSISEEPQQVDHNRWLVVDETGGLIVAALAERLGVLYPETEAARKKPLAQLLHAPLNGTQASGPNEPSFAESTEKPLLDPKVSTSPVIYSDTAPFETDNTITLIHPANQPNLSLLAYFNYDCSSPNPHHPLHTHLKTLTWLQLLHPNEDAAYQEPPSLSAETLATMKSGKRSAYYRKRRRWVRVSSTVDEARAGGFAGLVVASAMSFPGILHHCVPLLRGGAQVVVYSPTIEPAVELMDVYSTARRTAFLMRRGMAGSGKGKEEEAIVPSEEFPADPSLLLGTALHTARARPWQVLPGRTHPLMMGKGGADGYIFVGTRVLPAEGVVQAKGQFTRKKRRDGKETESTMNVESADRMDVDEGALS